MNELRVSIVIPVFNGGADLPKCLEAIASSSYRVRECIIVDDASTDGVIDGIANQYDVSVIALQNRKGPAHARNKGVEAATGDIVFFVDADVLLHEKTVAIAVELLESRPDLAAVFGSYDDQPVHDSFLSQYRNLFHHWVHQTGQNEASTFWTGCGAIRRQAFIDLGGFKTSYRKPSIEDIELGSRMRRSGYSIRLEPQMLCSHMKQWKFWNMIKTDIFQRGIPWAVLLLQNREAPNDLNVSNISRLATFLAGTLALSVLVLLLTGHAAATFPALVFLLAAAGCALFARTPVGGLPLALALVMPPTVAAYMLLPDKLAVIPLALILAVVWTHRVFYRYVARKRNMAFAFAVIPQQIVFFLACAVSGVLGLITYFFQSDQEPSAH